MKTVLENQRLHGLGKSGLIYILRLHLQLMMMAAAFFIAAGDIRYPRGWFYFALVSLAYVMTTVAFVRLSPELLNERAKRRENTKPWDKVLVTVYLLIAVFGIHIVAGLEIGRFRGASVLGARYILPGVLLYLASAGFAGWAMVVNKHFEATVRIQHDRDHQVITQGPYRWVRHPGYLSVMLGILGVPMILGSLAAFYCTAAVWFIMILRTALEDKTLQRELAGYKEYTQRVRSRLFPFLW